MTTKEYLTQIERLEKNIKNKYSEIFQLDSLAKSISIATDSEKVQTSGSKDMMGNIVAQMVDAKNEANAFVEAYLEKRRIIIGQIQLMDDQIQYQVLYSKYVEYKNLYAIANDIHYSRRQIIRIHQDALNAFEKKFGSGYKDVTKCHHRM